MRLIDVSHTIEPGMITYKGLPAPVICDFLSYEESRAHYVEGTVFAIHRIDMVGNTGTYLDAPRHRYPGRTDIAGLALESVAHLPGLVVRADLASGRAIGPEAFVGRDLRGMAVLVRTGWDRHWRTDRYFEGHPFLTRRAAEHLRDAGVALLGIDSLNVDDTDDGTRPVHSVVLGAGVPIVEHLCNLDALPEEGFRFFATPVKVSGCGTFPVRAFALVQ